MTLSVPEKLTVRKLDTSYSDLNDLLLSAREHLGAAASWIVWRDADGGLTIPVRGGDFPESWLDWPQGRDSVWGFATDRGPAFLNNLQSWTKLGDPPLNNLLSCPLIHNEQTRGYIVLANKDRSFALEDAAVLGGLAHHAVRLLLRRLDSEAASIEISPAWQRVSDRAAEAVLVLDADGRLMYANSAWLNWTGFRSEELIGRTAPFPFWVGAQDLERTLRESPVVPLRALPFRRRDQSVFWCQLEKQTERWNDRTVTISFLRQASIPTSSDAEEQSCTNVDAPEKPPSFEPATPAWLPLLLDLDGGIEGWGPDWQERTGLSADDVAGSRCDLVLDWLFPHQHDRERVADCFAHPGAGCQLKLTITTLTGSQRALCTFLPWASGATNALPRRWLLLVGDAQPLSEPHSLDDSLRLDSLSKLPGPHSADGEEKAPTPPRAPSEPRV